MKKGLTCLVVLNVLAFSCPPRSVHGASDRIIQKDGWVLEIWVTAKGTRSEGHVSHLYHNGSEVCPVNGKMKITTPLGTLRYVDGPYRWGWHGWKPVSKRIMIGP